MPRICKKNFGPNKNVTVDFLIGGDGDKRIVIEEIIEEHNLQSRVQMLGELVHSDVRDKLLIKGMFRFFYQQSYMSGGRGLLGISTPTPPHPEKLKMAQDFHLPCYTYFQKDHCLLRQDSRNIIYPMKNFD